MEYSELLLKGVETRGFRPLVFFPHELITYGSLIHTLKYFRIQFQIRGEIRIGKLFRGI
jgi:hypothetical protein